MVLGSPRPASHRDFAGLDEALRQWPRQLGGRLALDMQVMAGPMLSHCVFVVPGELAAEASRHSAPSQRKPSKTSLSDQLAQHEELAAKLLRERCLVAALAELERALCLATKHGDDCEAASAVAVQCRWQQLAASAIAWSLDLMADPVLWAEEQGSSEAADQALEMLCLAEMLTRPEVAETFGVAEMPSQRFFRALAYAGLGSYYHLRHKPQAALRFLEQAAEGHARWVHPAVLINLSAAYALVRESTSALVNLNRAVLAARSAAGRLCGENLSEVEAACKAAEAAVKSVLGVGLTSSQPQQASTNELCGESMPLQKVAGPSDVPDSQLDNVEVAVAHTLLGAKVLLWPWPEFREEEALASSSVAVVQELAEDATKKLLWRWRVTEEAAPGIARHAAQLKKTWPQWGQQMLADEAPGGALMLRECLLLSFLQAAAILRQCCPQATYSQLVIPMLHEGLALSIVLVGPKHPLARKLMNVFRKVQQRPAVARQLAASAATSPAPRATRTCSRRQSASPGRLHKVPLPRALALKRDQETRCTSGLGYVGRHGLLDLSARRASNDKRPPLLVAPARSGTPTHAPPRIPLLSQRPTSASATLSLGSLSLGSRPRSRGLRACQRSSAPAPWSTPATPRPEGDPAAISEPVVSWRVQAQLRVRNARSFLMRSPEPVLGNRLSTVSVDSYDADAGCRCGGIPRREAANPVCPRSR